MQAYHKAEKAKALKKAKGEKTKLRQEKLARRNPDRIARQIADFKALEESGELKPHDKKVLGELEKELVAVKKAREVVGVKEEERGPGASGGGRGGSTPGAGGSRGGWTARGGRGGSQGVTGSNAMKVDGRRGRMDRGDESDSGM